MGKVAAGVVLMLVFSGGCFELANAQTATTDENKAVLTAQNASELLKQIDLLVQQNGRLEKQNQDLMNVIGSLRQTLAEQAGETTAVQLQQAVLKETRFTSSSSAMPVAAEGSGTLVVPAHSTAEQEQRRTWGTYTPNFGYKVANTEYGDLNISIYTYARYLNQKGLEPYYTNAFGVTTKLQQRQDFQLNKVQFKFLGWMFDPRFRYFLYAWTSNANQGLGAQVVLAGNLNYEFKNPSPWGLESILCLAHEALRAISRSG